MYLRTAGQIITRLVLPQRRIYADRERDELRYNQTQEAELQGHRPRNRNFLEYAYFCPI